LASRSIDVAHSPRRPPPSFPTRRSSDLLSSNVFILRAQFLWKVILWRLATPFRTFLDTPPLSPCKSIWKLRCALRASWWTFSRRSEEHTSELQSRENLVCRLLLEKKN